MARIEWLVDKSAGTIFSFVLGGVSKINPFKKREINRPKDIAFIKLWALGESILSLPLIKSIKAGFPDAKVTVIARDKNAYVYEYLPFIDSIILFEPRNILKLVSLLRKFDLSIDCEPYLKLSGILSWFCAKQRIGFSHTVRSWLYTHPVDFNDKQHEVFSYMDMAKLLGIEKRPESLVKLCYSDADKTRVKSLLEQAGISGSDFIVGFCTGSADSSRQRIWPAEKFAELADRLIEEKNVKIVFVGSSSESVHIEYIRSLMKNNSVNFAGKTSKNELFCLMEKFNLFIGNDTGPMHVAAAQGVKTIGLFGPNISVRFGPFGKNNVSIEKFLPCRPCINVHKGRLPKCRQRKKLGEGYCMHLISIEDVLGAVNKLVN